eukprot:TRINITY_DN27868_c0_g1_i1.p1 TRINITY_DN27868_c0_g1~~TRINITY_DN27868_c0_g1_i1.p1  ORF type:complete len:986 (+),score=128.47 TRINITY_DN27868_c0_g1_i1:179-3136(+)
MSQFQKAYATLVAYIRRLAAEVRRLAASETPTPEQLSSYVAKTVMQLQKVISGAPEDLQERMVAPWRGSYDFWANQAEGQPMSLAIFLSILEALEGNFPDSLSLTAETPQKITSSKPLAVSLPNLLCRRAHTVPQMRADAHAFVPGKRTVDASAKARRKYAPEISPASRRLPTYDKKDWIIASIRHNKVTVISGDTGCGKSTLIPQLVCDAEGLVPDDKVIVCTEPRRVAAITLAEYVSKDRRQMLGDEVGYQIRFINKFTETTRLIYATTAIVLRRLHTEPTLESIGVLIIDEVHERDVYTDFLLLLLRESLGASRMNHLKLVLMSATLRAEDFAAYFSGLDCRAPLRPVHIPGHMFPVQVFYFEDACEWLGYCPPGSGGSPGQLRVVHEALARQSSKAGDPEDQACSTYSERTLKACSLWKEKQVYVDLIEKLVLYFHRSAPRGEGAILVFLPGWGEIRKVYARLLHTKECFTLIALHSLMTPEQQHRAFEKAAVGRRKVVLSTNIAEASVTIDDVVYVIDSGVRKERCYDPDLGVSVLETTMVTKANAVQRRGRAGRCQEGLVVHLFPSYEFESFSDFPLPQMLSSSMEEVVLQSKVIQGGSNSNICKMLAGSMAAPRLEAINDGIALLTRMGCLTKCGQLTSLGRATAIIPVHPSVAKFLLFAAVFRCIKPAACVAAFLSIKSPFQQPLWASGKDADTEPSGKDRFNKDFWSDHLTMVQAYAEWRQEVHRGRGDRFCERQGLSQEVLDMAYMMVAQFVAFMIDAGYDGPETREGDYAEISPLRTGSRDAVLVRAALVAGFSPNLCFLRSGQRDPHWCLDTNEEVAPFQGSVNAHYQMHGKDGEEWMVFSDSMKMGRFSSIMDSSLVFSPLVLLFAQAVLVGRARKDVSFDKWRATYEDGHWIGELLDLRHRLMTCFHDAIQARKLAKLPRNLVDRVACFCQQSPVALRKVHTAPVSIEDAAVDGVSHYEWPVDSVCNENAT